ncbi:MAG: polyprenyl synthetase family protein, partial [Longimicrobiales bacterium]|nr:polyprenyl synthetase family protein [Longimicrobiales bacterium]
MSAAAEILGTEQLSSNIDGASGKNVGPHLEPPTHSASNDFEELLKGALVSVSQRLEAEGIPVPALEGKLLRPFFALAMVPQDRRAELDDRFWFGALAIQMVHEASLLHDDVIDAAKLRRGKETVAAEHGVAHAVVLGDHYLTAAYRAAARTGSFTFLERFTRSAERTVAGEIAQGRAAGQVVALSEYDEIISGKSGELFGLAGILVATVAGLGDVEGRFRLGCDFGNLYQRIDDLLDYCDRTDTGKPPLQDYRHGKWSWVLGLAGVEGFGDDGEAVVDAIFRRRRLGPSPARAALEFLHDRKRSLLRSAARMGSSTEELHYLLGLCVGTAECCVREQEERMGFPSLHVRPTDMDTNGDRETSEALVRQRAGELGGPREWRSYFGDHARTFSLAARLFPPREAGLVSGLYAYCRFTDDLVDEPHDDPSLDVLSRRLDIWRELSLAAFDGENTGIPLLDTVLREAADKGVNRHYPEALLDGVAMDLAPRRYESWEELERYTFGVAGAVGGWMTQLFGLHDPELLERAHALGHGMQLTNIARDVGE